MKWSARIFTPVLLGVLLAAFTVAALVQVNLATAMDVEMALAGTAGIEAGAKTACKKCAGGNGAANLACDTLCAVPIMAIISPLNIVPTGAGMAPTPVIGKGVTARMAPPDPDPPRSRA